MRKGFSCAVFETTRLYWGSEIAMKKRWPALAILVALTLTACGVWLLPDLKQGPMVKFERIKIGMTEERVRTVLGGRPLVSSAQHFRALSALGAVCGGLMSTRVGQGPVLAASALIPGSPRPLMATPEYTVVWQTGNGCIFVTFDANGIAVDKRFSAGCGQDEADLVVRLRSRL